jgi:hypothetical protein
MGGGETSWSEKIVTNTIGGLAFGTIYGAVKGAWMTAPNPKLIGNFVDHFNYPFTFENYFYRVK